MSSIVSPWARVVWISAQRAFIFGNCGHDSESRKVAFEGLVDDVVQPFPVKAVDRFVERVKSGLLILGEMRENLDGCGDVARQLPVVGNYVFKRDGWEGGAPFKFKVFAEGKPL
jgi:hypothetical protein